MNLAELAERCEKAGACILCLGGNWVCEDHRDKPWHGTANVEACCGGAGSPCPLCQPEMAAAGYVDRREKAVAAWLREIEPSYSGWNDHDEHFDRGWNGAIEWVAEQLATGKHWSALRARSIALAEGEGDHG